MFVDRPGKMSVSFAPIADRLPPQVRRGFLGGGLPVPEGKDQLYRDSQLATLKMTKLLYDSGITIVAGTDDLPGFTLHRELELYVKAGIAARMYCVSPRSAERAWRRRTRSSVRSLRASWLTWYW
jgi:hypothetical protein